ncbi:MAG TPA: cache domain-containing protein [Kofleriaceae bacterium]|jgi:two-component system NarL family sensor kinase
MQLRYKVVALAVVPLMLAAGLLAFVVRGQSHALVRSQIDGIDELLARDELRNLMKLARKAIPELDSPEHDDPATRHRVLEQLRSLDFGENGYFYVYDLNGTNLMHPWQRHLENNSQWGLTDDHGQPIIQQLTETALTSGADGGFRRYRWPRPPQRWPQQWADKLGYVVRLPHWGWMLGTGIYLDDIHAIDKTAQQIQASSAAAVSRTMLSIAVIAALAVVVVAWLGVALNVSQRRLADAKLRKLTWQVVAAEEQERARMSRFLHDEAMQDLIAVRVVLETAVIELKDHASHAGIVATLEHGLVGLTQGVDHIRKVSHGLRPRLQRDGLAALLAQTGAAFFDRSGVTATVEAPAAVQPMSAEAATALFRVTQQALDNVERHARATHVMIRLAASRRRGSSGTRLSVTDDGCGFDVAAVEARPGGGIGLLNMRERIEALGGRLFIRSGSNGTHVEAFLPNEAPREGELHGDSNDDDNHET